MSDIRLISSGLPNLLPMQGRSPGLHVSDILHDLCLHLGHYKEQESSMTRMQLGCALEDSLALRYAQEFPDRYIRLGELSKDGIPGTPDLYDVELEMPVEMKLTWMSSRHEPDSEKFWKYWAQVGSYAEMTESDASGLIVVHVNGDYKSFDVVANQWLRKWGRLERQKNWDMIRRHYERMTACGLG